MTPTGDFRGFADGALLPCAASPPLEEDLSFRGLAIAAPSRVVHAGRRTFLPIAGGYHLDLRSLPVQARFEQHVHLVVASNAGARLVRVVEEPGVGTDAAAGDPGLGSVIEYFNVDLGVRLDDLEPSVVHVYAFIGPWISNVVRVEIAEEAP